MRAQEDSSWLMARVDRWGGEVFFHLWDKVNGGEEMELPGEKESRQN